MSIEFPTGSIKLIAVNDVPVIRERIMPAINEPAPLPKSLLPKLRKDGNLDKRTKYYKELQLINWKIK